jgi:hypothetical protein
MDPDTAGSLIRQPGPLEHWVRDSEQKSHVFKPQA